MTGGENTGCASMDSGMVRGTGKMCTKNNNKKKVKLPSATGRSLGLKVINDVFLNL